MTYFNLRFIFRSIFKFLSSLKLAVIVILGLAYILALGTIYESLYGTAIAKEKVYGTFWFTLVLALLGVNVLCAALSRLPWRRHHIGFVVTHAGILVILAGSLMTQRWGIDGTLVLVEGETGNRVVVDEPLLQVAQPDLGLVESWEARFSEKGKAWAKTMEDETRIVIDEFYRHSDGSLKVNPGSEADPPALQVVLSGLPFSEGELRQWLFLKETELASQALQMGPLKISFLDLEVLQSLTNEPSASPHKIGGLKLTLADGKTLEIDANQALKQEIQLADTPYRLKGLRYLPDAVVVDKKLVSRSDQPNNPAFEFKIFGPEGEESHLVFSEFPDFEGIHGKPQGSKIKAQFLVETPRVKAKNAELYLATPSTLSPEGRGIKGEGVEISYRLRSKGKLSELKEAKLNEEVITGWMNIRFKVTDYLPRAFAQMVYRRVVPPPGKTGPPPAIHVRVEKEGQSAEGWLQQGDMKVLNVKGIPYRVRYGMKSYPLGFSLKLNKFEIGRYPGTGSPSSYESMVEVSDPPTGEKFETKIHMNHPLHRNGYTFYQSSYQEMPEGPDISIFSVANDPGTPVKYAGSILLVSGIILMFWFKPLFIQKRLEAKRNSLRRGSTLRQDQGKLGSPSPIIPTQPPLNLRGGEGGDTGHPELPQRGPLGVEG